MATPGSATQQAPGGLELIVGAAATSALVGADKNTGYMNTAGVAGGLVGTPVAFPSQGATDAKLAYASQAVANFDVDNDDLADMVFSSSITRKLRYYKRLSATVGDYDLASPHDIDAVLPAAGDPRPAVAGDVTGDGKIDLILSLAGSGSTDATKTTLYLYTNLGTATFSRTAIATGLTPSSYPSGLVGKTLWDLNADGRLDLVVYAPIGTSSAAQLQVFINVGGATPFNSSNRTALTGATGTLLGTIALWGSVTAADFDHDGLGDLVALGPNKKLWFLKGQGGTTFTIPASPIQTLSSLNLGSHILEHTALDGDSLIDLLLTPAYSSSDKPLLVFKGQGDGTSFAATPDQTIAAWGTNVAPEVGACRFLPDGASCSDGRSCTGPDTCQGGRCAGPAVACPGMCGVQQILTADALAAPCPEGGQPKGCRQFDCANGTDLGTWTKPPVCGLTPACTSSCSACTTTSTGSAGVVEAELPAVSVTEFTLLRDTAYTIETLDLQAGVDTIIDIAIERPDATANAQALLASNDDAPGDVGRSLIQLPAYHMDRTVKIIVRGAIGTAAGTATLQLTPAGLLAIRYPLVQVLPPFTKVIPTAGLREGTLVQTVELLFGTPDTVLWVTSPTLGVIAFNDDGGVDRMSAIWTPECPGPCIITAASKDASSGPARLLWDEDMANGRDADSDHLGNALEGVLGTLTNNPDTDADGIPDGLEYMGTEAAGPPATGAEAFLKFPSYGANPQAKDLFIEYDWWCPSSVGPIQCELEKVGGRGPAVAASISEFFIETPCSPGQERPCGSDRNITVHIDTGRVNTDAATKFTYNDWGGANRAPIIKDGNGNDDAPYCGGRTTARDGLFLHGLAMGNGVNIPAGGGSTTGRCSRTNPASLSGARDAAHEHGHSLGLEHNGKAHDRATGRFNCKPNYASQMNYAFPVSPFSRGEHRLYELTGSGLNEDAPLFGGTLTPAERAHFEGLFGFSIDGLGRVDWNRDGIWESTRLVRAAPNWRVQDPGNDCGTLTNAIDPNLLLADGTAAVAAMPPPGGDRVMAFTRSGGFGTLNFLAWRTSTMGGFSSCTEADAESGPCVTWGAAHTLAAEIDDVDAVGFFGTDDVVGRVALVTTDRGTRHLRSREFLSVDGEEGVVRDLGAVLDVGAPPRVIPGSGPGTLLLFGQMGGRLHQWSYSDQGQGTGWSTPVPCTIAGSNDPIDAPFGGGFARGPVVYAAIPQRISVPPPNPTVARILVGTIDGACVFHPDAWTVTVHGSANGFG